MKAAEARKLIGKTIEWKYKNNWLRHGEYTGKVLEVAGKNVLIDSFGNVDWRWLPDMIDVKVVE